MFWTKKRRQIKEDLEKEEVVSGNWLIFKQSNSQHIAFFLQEIRVFASPAHNDRHLITCRTDFKTVMKTENHRIIKFQNDLGCNRP